MLFGFGKNTAEKLIDAFIGLNEAEREFKEAKEKAAQKLVNIKPNLLRKYQDNINYWLDKRYNAEKDFIDENIHRGLYVGIGVNLETFDRRPLVLNWDNLTNHMIVYGTTRVGKTKFMLSNIRQNILHGDNVVINDPKGGIGHEVYHQTLEFLYEAGREQDLLVVNTADLNATDIFNPLYGLDDNEISSMIAGLIFPTVGATGDTKFYSGYAQLVLSTILRCLTFLQRVHDPEGSHTRKRIEEDYQKYYEIQRRIIKEGGINSQRTSDTADRIFTEVNIIFEKIAIKKADNGIPSYCRDLVTFRDLHNYVSIVGKKGLFETVRKEEGTAKGFESLENLYNECAELIADVEAIPPEHHTKISLSLTQFLATVSTGDLGKILCSIGTNPILQRLTDKDRGMVLLVYPSPLKFKETAEHFNKIILKMLQVPFAHAASTGKKSNPRRLYVHLDEGESSMSPGAETILNKLGGVGLTMCVYTQSLADLVAKMGDTLSKVAQDSLNTYFIMKTNDPSSCSDIVRMFSSTSNVQTSMISGGGDARISYSKNFEFLISEEYLLKLKPAQSYLKHAGLRYKISFPFVPDPDSNETIISSGSMLDNKLMELKEYEENAKKTNIFDSYSKEELDRIILPLREIKLSDELEAERRGRNQSSPSAQGNKSSGLDDQDKGGNNGTNLDGTKEGSNDGNDPTMEVSKETKETDQKYANDEPKGNHNQKRQKKTKDNNKNKGRTK